MSSVKQDVSDNEPLYSNLRSTISAPSHSFSLQCLIAGWCEMHIVPLIVIPMSQLSCIVLHCLGTAGQIHRQSSDIILCRGLQPPSPPNTHILNFNDMFEQTRQHWVLTSKLLCKQCPALPGSAQPGPASGLLRGLHAPPSE